MFLFKLRVSYQKYRKIQSSNCVEIFCVHLRIYVLPSQRNKINNLLAESNIITTIRDNGQTDNRR